MRGSWAGEEGFWLGFARELGAGACAHTHSGLKVLTNEVIDLRVCV